MRETTMQLTWTVSECFEAEAQGGGVYSIRKMVLNRKNRYIAIHSYLDVKGRLNEYTVGVFLLLEDAKKACENDAKS